MVDLYAQEVSGTWVVNGTIYNQGDPSAELTITVYYTFFVVPGGGGGGGG